MSFWISFHILPITTRLQLHQHVTLPFLLYPHLTPSLLNGSQICHVIWISKANIPFKALTVSYLNSCNKPMPGLPDSDLPLPYFCTQMAVAVILHRKFDLCCQVPLPKWNSRNVSVNIDIYLPLSQLVQCFIPLFLGCVTLEYLLPLSQKTLWFFSSQWEKKRKDGVLLIETHQRISLALYSLSNTVTNNIFISLALCPVLTWRCQTLIVTPL